MIFVGTTGQHATSQRLTHSSSRESKPLKTPDGRVSTSMARRLLLRSVKLCQRSAREWRSSKSRFFAPVTPELYHDEVWRKTRTKRAAGPFFISLYIAKPYSTHVIASVTITPERAAMPAFSRASTKAFTGPRPLQVSHRKGEHTCKRLTAPQWSVRSTLPKPGGHYTYVPEIYEMEFWLDNVCSMKLGYF